MLKGEYNKFNRRKAMPELTFGEQVKIVLKRRNMTIKELAESIETNTGKKMSRQNLTQRLTRDNFQEQDMRMIAGILGCPLKLSILEEEVSAVPPITAKPQTAAALPITAEPQAAAAPPITAEPQAAAALPITAEPQAAAAPPVTAVPPISAEPSVEPSVLVTQSHPAADKPSTAAEPLNGTEPSTFSEAKKYEEPVSTSNAYARYTDTGYTDTGYTDTGYTDTEYTDARYTGAGYIEEEYTGNVYFDEQLDEPEENVEMASDMSAAEKTIDYKADYTVEELLAEVEALEAEAKESRENRRTYSKENNGKQHGWMSYLRRNKRNADSKTKQTDFSDSIYGDFPEDEGEEDDDIQIFDIDYEPGEELYITEGFSENDYVDDEENLEIGDANPYTGREYRTNSVRMHPDRIGYVQVYDRADHRWTDMTEWAFLGYQERKKALLGDDYEPPIYLD